MNSNRKPIILKFLIIMLVIFFSSCGGEEQTYYYFNIKKLIIYHSKGASGVKYIHICFRGEEKLDTCFEIEHSKYYCGDTINIGKIFYLETHIELDSIIKKSGYMSIVLPMDLGGHYKGEWDINSKNNEILELNEWLE